MIRSITCPKCRQVVPEDDLSHSCFPLCSPPEPLHNDEDCSFGAVTVDEIPPTPVGSCSADETLPFVPSPNKMETAQLSPPSRFGGYDLHEEIGRGGMGIVHKAWQRGAKRFVALKIIKSSSFIDTELRERFRKEGEALGQLKDSHIVSIYEVGEIEGCPYFSMEFVEGGNLATYLKCQRMSPRDAARMIATLAGAMETAHRAGVLHRDIKPGNILLDKMGVPKITDFGLAKYLDKEESQTVDGYILGTPNYMAPEQASGRNSEVAAPTDVYAMGATLYEMLTLVPPFVGKTRIEILNKVLTKDPKPLARHCPGIDRQLEAICLKCLDKNPKGRYATAGDLRDDLERWLRGESTVAQPLRWPSRLWRTVRRRRAVFGVSGLVAMAVLMTVLLVRGSDSHRTEEPIDPNAPLLEIASELEAGQPVTLIGKAGPPRWMRWRPEGGEGQIQSAATPFTFQTQPETYLELLPRVPLSRFQFSAEIRHVTMAFGAVNPETGKGLASRDRGFVGLYLGFRSRELPKGGFAFRCYRVSFIDDDDPPRPKPTPPYRSYVRFVDLLDLCDRDEVRRGVTLEPGNRTFEPSDGLPRLWRKIVIQVREDSIKAFWRTPEGHLEPFANLSDGDRREHTNQLKEQLDDLFARQSAGLTLWDVDPLDGLGLFAHRSTVAIQNVVIEPLF